MNDNCKGYELIHDTNSGKTIAVETATGEMLDTVTATVPVGTIMYTPEQQRAYKERKERDNEKMIIKSHIGELGNYFFIASHLIINDIKPETLTRLLYLSTYAEYNTGRLRKTQRTTMVKSDLPKILNVSESTALRFLKDADNYITENGAGDLILNSAILKKGTLNKKEFVPYQKVYSEAFRNLYNNSSSTMHKRMGYIFQMLPYINVEHNVLCYNPYESDFNQIDFMTPQGLCEAIGYSIPMFYRLRKAFSELRINYKGKEEHLITIRRSDEDSDVEHIYINPHIIYSGSNYAKLESIFSLNMPESTDVSHF